MELSMTKFTSH
jgi:predicted nuclease with TOPRIM domain